MPRKYESDKPAENQRVPSHTRDEAWTIEFLKRAEIGHVAHSQGDQPFITPTNFWFDEENRRIIFHSNIAGRQRYNMENNPKVSMEASEYGRFLAANTALEFGIQYRSVMVFGRIRILEDDQERISVLNQLLKKYFPHLTPGKEFRPITQQELARTTVYSLDIDSWSGKENWDDYAEELPDWAPLPEEYK